MTAGEQVSPLEDTGLVERAQGGSGPAREELALALLPRVRKLVHLTAGDREDVDDLVQSAMVQIFTDMPGYRGEGRFAAWADRVTVNTVRRHYRRRPLLRLFDRSKDVTRSPAGEGSRPDRRAERDRIARLLGEHLSAILIPKRMALVLHAAYGYSVAEIARIEGCTVETAKKRLQHGRRELVELVLSDPMGRQLLKELER